jgi:hypothetical protein
LRNVQGRVEHGGRKGHIEGELSRPNRNTEGLKRSVREDGGSRGLCLRRKRRKSVDRGQRPAVSRRTLRWSMGARIPQGSDMRDYPKPRYISGSAGYGEEKGGERRNHAVKNSTILIRFSSRKTMIL